MQFSLTQFLTDIGNGIGSFMPNVMKGLLDGFTSIFFTTTGSGDTSTTTLSLVGIVAIGFIVIGACYKFIPTVLKWLRLGVSRARSRRKRR